MVGGSVLFFEEKREDWGYLAGRGVRRSAGRPSRLLNVPGGWFQPPIERYRSYLPTIHRSAPPTNPERSGPENFFEGS
jgi:hypothetical protein